MATEKPDTISDIEAAERELASRKAGLHYDAVKKLRAIFDRAAVAKLMDELREIQPTLPTNSSSFADVGNLLIVLTNVPANVDREIERLGPVASPLQP